MPHNIILFLTDQWRWDTLNSPQSIVRLPNLRDFSLKGTNFTNAFTTVPLCTPARASLFTGKWPHQTGAMDNVQGRSYYPFGCLHSSQTTYLERLLDCGYDVTYIGKWHLGDGGLLSRGINNAIHSDGGTQPIAASSIELSADMPSYSPYYGTLVSDESEDGQRVDEAIAQLDRLRKSVKPFCLVVSLHGPHFPHHVPKRFVDLYDNLPADYLPDNFCVQYSEKTKPQAQARSYWPCQETKGLTMDDWRLTAQHYFAFCSYLDHLFGRFVKAVAARNLTNDTVLAFTSDHGEMLGAHGWFDKGPFFYEEVMRIPMLIRTPAGDPRIEDNNFVSLRDLWPTLADAANVPELLCSEELERSYWRSSESFVPYCYDSYQGRQFKIRGIRTQRYKYSWSPNDLAELYDLESDAGERENLINHCGYTEVKAQLHGTLMEWMERESDYLRIPAHHLPVGSYVDGRAQSFDPDNKIPGR